MPRISSYPTKGTPTSSDIMIIADVADSNSTKQATIASLTSVTTSGAFTTLTSGAAVTWDFSDSANALLVLGAGVADTLSIVNVSDGDHGSILVDGTANQTMTLPTGGTVISKIAGGTGYTPSSRIDLLRFVCRVSGGNTVLYWSIGANYQTYV